MRAAAEYQHRPDEAHHLGAGDIPQMRSAARPISCSRPKIMPQQLRTHSSSTAS